MGILKLILVPVAIGVLAAAVWNLLPEKEVWYSNKNILRIFFSQINVEENNYYGSGKAKPDNTEIKPFKVNVEQSVIDVRFSFLILVFLNSLKTRAFKLLKCNKLINLQINSNFSPKSVSFKKKTIIL